MGHPIIRPQQSPLLHRQPSKNQDWSSLFFMKLSKFFFKKNSDSKISSALDQTASHCPNSFAAHENALALEKNFFQGVKIRLSLLINELNKKTNRTVQAGPFQGMKLAPQPESYFLRKEFQYGWVAHQLLGCLEEELHPSIEYAIQRAPEVVVNVGCGEGYYAIGMAKRLPHAEIYAFDSSARARELCTLAAEENGVADRVHIKGTCDEKKLLAFARSGKKLFLFIDCEGDELTLLTPRCIEALRHADIIVECHDFQNPLITPTLLELLIKSHRVDFIQEGPRNPSAMPLLKDFSSFDRWLCMCEFRPRLMWWLACWRR